jgi:DNA-directed RNA polymerase specialized sigma24 family protein
MTTETLPAFISTPTKRRILLDKARRKKAVQAEVVKLRYFVGMTNAEVTQPLGLSERTVKNYWTHARAWLIREINAVRTTGYSLHE